MVEMVDMRHELVALETLIDWDVFEREWVGFFPSHTGSPGDHDAPGRRPALSSTRLCALDRGRFPVRQKVDDPPPLQVADHSAVSLSLAPGPVVDTDDAEVTARGLRHVLNAAQERILADGQ